MAKLCKIRLLFIYIYIGLVYSSLVEIHVRSSLHRNASSVLLLFFEHYSLNTRTLFCSVLFQFCHIMYVSLYILMFYFKWALEPLHRVREFQSEGPLGPTTPPWWAWSLYVQGCIILQSCQHSSQHVITAQLLCNIQSYNHIYIYNNG